MTADPLTTCDDTGPGTLMFARYAYAPNSLGHCGPEDVGLLRDGSDVEIRAAARRFTGAWPYLRVLARLTGIPDPLDRRLVESYWHGGGLGAQLDPEQFLAELLAVIGPAAGRYWTYLTTALAHEAAADHSFHVFAVYPWTRFLGRGSDRLPLHILDNCRISWATVVSVDGTDVVVARPRLDWDGHRLSLTEPVTDTACVDTGSRHAVTTVAPGDRVALHWGRICATLTDARCRDLHDSTTRQLRCTSRRLTIPARE